MASRESIFEAGDVSVVVVQGDITRLERPVDVVVSSDDNYLSAGGGVSAAIRRAAASAEVDAQALALAGGGGRSPLQVGAAVVTAAGKLGAKVIVHAVVIDLDRAIWPDRSIAEAATRGVLDAAAGFGSIALPLIGSGAGRLPEEVAAEAVACGAVDFGFYPRGRLQQIFLVGVDERSRRAFEHAVRHAVEEAGERRRTASENARRLFGAPIKDLWSRDPSARARAIFESVEQLRERPPVLTDQEADVTDAKRDLSREEHAILTAASRLVRERNELAHGKSPDGRRSEEMGRDFETLLTAGSAVGAAAGLVPWSSALALSAFGVAIPPAAPLIAAGAGALALVAARRRAKERRQAPEPPPTSSQVLPDEPVVRLAQLLGEQLDSGELSLLTERLAGAGFKGEFDACLVEYCLETDPVDLICEWLKTSQLVRVLESRGLKRETLIAAPQRDLASRLLQSLGFTIPTKPEGIREASARIAKCASKLQIATSTQETRGCIIEAAQTFEGVAADLLRFYAIALFGQPWPQQLVRRELLGEEDAPARLSLGTLIASLARLDRLLADVKDDTDAIARTRWRELFGGRPILGTVGRQAQEIARVRNDLAHYRERIEKMDVPAMRQFGRQVLDEVLLPLMRHIVDERVYPTVIAVKAYVRDAYGRAWIDAIDDEGNSQKIYTKEQLDPAATYFMVPKTNPARIDPLLIQRRATTSETEPVTKP